MGVIETVIESIAQIIKSTIEAIAEIIQATFTSFSQLGFVQQPFFVANNCDNNRHYSSYNSSYSKKVFKIH